MTTGAIYDAVVTHVRAAPVDNRFRYRTFYWLVDLDDPPRLRWPLRSLARFDPSDHLDVRAFLRGHGLDASRILMLANARVLGYVFNPITVYWCYDAGGRQVAQVAEVHNTYGGRHAYLLDPDDHGRSTVAKELYVSPFYPVDGSYTIRVSEPGPQVAVSVTLRRDADQPFVATLVGRRHPATLRHLLSAWLRYPWAPLRTSLLIRWQGIRLWRRGLEVQPR
jgi:uncharacterized protein